MVTFTVPISFLLGLPSYIQIVCEPAVPGLEGLRLCRLGFPHYSEPAAEGFATVKYYSK